jgi:reverse gyrase
MDCPRCGGSLTSYQLADAETVACDDCIYVGVSVDHTSKNQRPEPWTDALERFYRGQQSVEQVEEIVAHEDVPLSDAVIPVFEAADRTDASAEQNG